MPFKKEYFDNDSVINELFQDNNNQIRNERINNRINEDEQPQGNINNNIINTDEININNRRENVRENQIININNRFININNPPNYARKEKLLIRSEKKDLGLYLSIIFLNIFFWGFGTIGIGISNNCCFYILLGIFQLLDFIFCIASLSIYIPDIEDSYIIYYFLIKCILIYLSLIYIAIFNNLYCHWNPRRIKKVEEKEKALISIYANILFGGVGTLLMAVQKKNIIRNILFGLFQFGGFIVLFWGLICFENDKQFNLEIIILLIIGGVSYIFSLIYGIFFYLECNKK